MNRPIREKNPLQQRLAFLIRALFGAVLIAACLFLAAGRINWPMAWAYLAAYLIISTITAFISDPSLLGERMQRRQKDQKSWDRPILGMYGLILPFVIPVVAGLDVRNAWAPEIPPVYQIVALILYLLGWGIHLWALAVNRYFALVVRLQPDRDQRVATNGPYRYVRHPGYAGGILLTMTSAPALGSWWAFIPALFGAILLVIRTGLEDRTLREELAGYQDYAQKVRYRLIPGIW